MGIIKVKNIKLYAFHGCLDEEAAIGSPYRVDVKVKADLKKSAKTDQCVNSHLVLAENENASFL